MVGPGRVVAERDGRPGADEDRARVLDPVGDGGGVGGLDLQVLRAVGVDHAQPLVQAVDEDDRGLAAGQGRTDPVLDVLGGLDLRPQLLLHRVRQLRGVGDQDGGGQRVVLGLADQVGGDVHRVGGRVRQDGDLGRTGLGVDADLPGEEALGGGDPDVPGAGDHVGGRAGLRAVREHRDGGGPAGRVDLVDAEQGAGGQDGGVRDAAELGLRGRGERDRADTGLLRGHHVHDHGRRVDRPAAGHVQPDPLDRHPLLGDRPAGHDLRGVRGAALLAVDEAGTADGLLERGAHGRVEALQRAGQLLGRDTHLFQPDAVELLGEVDQRRVPAMMHGLADRTHLLQGDRDVEVGSGQQVAQGGALGEGVAAQIDSGDHGTNSLRPASGTVRAYQWLIRNATDRTAQGELARSVLTLSVRKVTQRA